jgi:hypothetical protein
MKRWLKRALHFSNLFPGLLLGLFTARVAWLLVEGIGRFRWPIILAVITTWLTVVIVSVSACRAEEG